MVSERKYRRNNQRWTGAELDRLLRSVKLEDVTPTVERFYSIASALERTPLSVRGMWLQVRDTGLRGKRSESPTVAAYASDRFPRTDPALEGDGSIDALIAAYRQAQRTADALMERIFTVAGRDAEALAGLKQTLLAAGAVARPHVEAADKFDPVQGFLTARSAA